MPVPQMPAKLPVLVGAPSYVHPSMETQYNAQAASMGIEHNFIGSTENPSLPPVLEEPLVVPSSDSAVEEEEKESAAPVQDDET